MNSGILTTARLTVTAGTTATINGASWAEEYDPTNITYVQGDASPSAVLVELEGGTLNRTEDVSFAAPTGTDFQDGFYYGDDVYGQRGLGEVDGPTAGCQYASFTVTDVAYSGTTLNRLDLHFQTTCDIATSNVNANIFGELQLGEPEPNAAVTTNVRNGSWPDVPVGTLSTATWPAWIRNTGTSSVRLGQLIRGGSNAGDFRVVTDGCSGHILAGHASCQIDIAFGPTAANSRASSWSIPAGATAVTFQLSGTGSPGTTLLRLNSQPGDFVGGGLNYVITNAQEQMQVDDQMPGEFIAGVQNPSSGIDWWQVQIGSPTGVLALGTHPTNELGLSGQYELDVTGHSRTCNVSTGTVDVKQASFDSDYAPTAIDITFSQTCGGSTAALTGEIEYHATTAGTVPPPSPTVYASDTFSRNSSSGFGTADPTGQLWVATAKPQALAVTPGRGTITLSPGATSSTYLAGVSHTDLDVDATIAVPKLPVGGSNGDSFYLYPRRVSSTQGYALLARVDPSGHVYLSLVKYTGTGAATNISSAVKIGVTSPNQAIHLRVEAVGSSPTLLRARGWLANAAEPTTWTVTASDSGAGLQVAGEPAIGNYLSAATTNGSITTNLTGFVAESTL